MKGLAHVSPLYARLLLSHDPSIGIFATPSNASGVEVGLQSGNSFGEVGTELCASRPMPFSLSAPCGRSTVAGRGIAVQRSWG